MTLPISGAISHSTIMAEFGKTELLGQVPIVMGVRSGGDNGEPAATDEESVAGKVFKDMAKNVIKQVALRNQSQDPTEMVKITTQ